MEVSYRESFNKTKKERQQRAAVQALEFNGWFGGGGQPPVQYKEKIGERGKGRVKERGGPHCNFQANVKFLQNIQILKLLVENIFNFRLFPASFQLYFSFTK